jgi:CheY-like chemotaxis protein
MRFSILVVDDNDDLRDMLGDFLEKEGFEVMTASDGPEALAALERGLDPGFILLDIMMPGMSGFEVLARIRSERLRPDIPIALMSGSHLVDAAPGTYFLQKPFDLERLLQLIRRHDCNLPPSVAATLGNVCP